MDKDKFTKTFKELLPYLITIVVILLFKQFLYCPVRVNGSSMYSTLKENDIMILNRIHYRFNDIKRFDIVVVDAEDELLIKRVIGLPGEEIKYKNNKLYIDGKYIKEDFKHKKTEDFTYKIPKGEYFVLSALMFYTDFLLQKDLKNKQSTVIKLSMTVIMLILIV